jgi:membrane protease YdiL (CAAX protease family)
MFINYKFLFFIYLPVIILIPLLFLKDRFEPSNQNIKHCLWSLLPSIILISFLLSAEVIRSLWYFNISNILNTFPYNPSNLELFGFVYILIILSLLFILFRFVFKVSIIEIFNIKFSGLSFIVKLCLVLGIINILSIYLFDLNLILSPQKLWIDYIKSMDLHGYIFFLIVSTIFSPVIEEMTFRGLLYGPTQRKVGRIFAIVLTSLIWTCGHLQNLSFSIGMFITGIILGWLYDRRGSILDPIIFHVFKNSWVLFTIYK